ncbi:SDR family oxidoreductase [Rhizorhabdus argentea]|uniref:SDR family oxidoreductase n=1 Tax=Rhizorhabdus argentea TaxID=1387174 RepID=UPI0030EB9F37
MRTIVVTGSASGIGAACSALLRERGDRVIGVDLANADVNADLSGTDGRGAMVQQVSSLAGGRVDAVLACAGISSGPAGRIVSVNFFGAVASLQGLRPLLSASPEPRAVAISSFAALMGQDDATVTACLEMNEDAAVAAIGDDAEYAYYSSKMALSLWIKQNAVGQEWAGSGIVLNAVAPGMVATPMIQPLLDTQDGRDFLNGQVPSALGRPSDPRELAELLVFFGSPQNSFVIGQTIYCDGGAEALRRPGRI